MTDVIKSRLLGEPIYVSYPDGYGTQHPVTSHLRQGFAERTFQYTTLSAILSVWYHISILFLTDMGYS